MRKSICLILILTLISLLFVSFGCNKEDVDTSFRVMTFNIRLMTYEENPENNWERRKELVLNTIKKYDADLIGFQEVMLPQYQYLQQNLTDYGFYGVDRTGTVFSESAAIFYRKSRFEVISEETFWLSETPEIVSKGWDAGVQRTCTVIKFKDKLNGKELYHYNTHFDNQGELAREKSAELVLEKIKDLNNVILSGDLNTREGSDVYNNLVSGTLKDSKYLAPEDNTDEGGTTQGFGTFTRTIPIDFIMVTESYFKVTNYKIIRDTSEDGHYPSDHFPIFADLDYND